MVGARFDPLGRGFLVRPVQDASGPNVVPFLTKWSEVGPKRGSPLWTTSGPALVRTTACLDQAALPLYSRETLVVVMLVVQRALALRPAR